MAELTVAPIDDRDTRVAPLNIARWQTQGIALGWEGAAAWGSHLFNPGLSCHATECRV